ncbi:hypothetical protein HDC37_003161 [Microbacterium sp. AK009]|uniref:peptidase inhibitor family I36 protein n=1 Tax=Microbacterium sp. AK009 TaxID=2723068 RepID=UPI0015CD6CF2|nr:peptidase inhibitor family I36 protein [Microbacterium sp. AK009]NYF18305.1 hypothetical protein [Microbacterium sp. AK009]
MKAKERLIPLRQRATGGRSRLRAAIGLALVVGATSAIAVAPPASASIAQCSSNRACGWFDPNYASNFGAWTSAQWSMPGGVIYWPNNISSTFNKRTHNITWFMDVGYAGGSMFYPPTAGGYYSWPHMAENNIESLRFY